MFLDHWGLSDRIDNISLVTDAVLMSKCACIALPPLLSRVLSFISPVGDGDVLGSHRWVAELLKEAGGEFAAVPVRPCFAAASPPPLTIIAARDTTGDPL